MTGIFGSLLSPLDPGTVGPDRWQRTAMVRDLETTTVG